MEIERKLVKKLWAKLTVFLEREMTLTLLFWLITFLIVFTTKIIFMIKILDQAGNRLLNR
jgi:hypothetical protein